MRRGLIVLGTSALVGLTLVIATSLGVQKQSFLGWIDDPAHDDSLLAGRLFTVGMRASPSTETVFADGAVFLFGIDAAEEKAERSLKCIELDKAEVIRIPLPSFPDNTEMWNVERLPSHHWVVNFWEPQARTLPRSHTAVDLNEKCRFVAARNLPVSAEEWETLNRSINLRKSPESSSAGTERPASRISWLGKQVTLLFSSFSNQPKVYVFDDDKFVGVHGIALAPLGPVFFLKSGNHFLIKTIFKVVSEGPPRSNSEPLIGTAAWSLDANEIEVASLSRPWMLIQASRGNRTLFVFYNLTEILNAAAKRYGTNATADW